MFLGSTTPGEAYRYWKDYLLPLRDRDGRVIGEPRQGFGFQLTMHHTGFLWFIDKMNWAQLVFRPELSALLLFRRLNIESRFRRHAYKVSSAYNFSHRIEMCGDYFRRFRNSESCRNLLFDLFNQICGLQFRRDVFTHLMEDILLEFREDARAGMIPLAYDSLVKVLRRGEDGIFIKRD